MRPLFVVLIISVAALAQQSAPLEAAPAKQASCYQRPYRHPGRNVRSGEDNINQAGGKTQRKRRSSDAFHFADLSERLHGAAARLN